MILFEIINDGGKSTDARANYTWKVLINFKEIATGKIKNFPRLQKDAKDLFRLALEQWEKQ